MSHNVFKRPPRDPASADAVQDLQRTNAETRIPELVNEFRSLYDALRPLIKATQDGNGQTVRMTISVPREWAMLAAWLQLRELKSWSNDLSPLKYAINLDRRFADWQHARNYMWRTLNDHFHYELHLLAIGAHPYLYDRKAKPENDTDCDDDIPF